MKSIQCKDFGLKCDWSMQGENEDEILKKAEEHAKQAHGLKNFSQADRDRARSLIREAKAA